MPELPEVEAARRAIEENCLGKKIKRAIIANDSKVIEGISSLDFESALLGKTIVSAHRKGKNLWLHLDSPPFPSFQFGMAGAIYIKGVAVTKYKRSAVKDNDEWPSKYSKFFVELDDGLELSFTDKRRFARVRLLKDPTSVPPISELGPDALFEPMTINEFTDSLSKKKIGIKALLLDQICSSLSKENCATLHNCIKEVIEKAVEVGADSSQFPSNWIFHSREKKPGKAFVDDIRICTGLAEIEWNSSYKSSSGGNNDVSSEEDDEDPTEKGRKVKTNTSNKQAKTVKTSKRAVSSQDGKKPKRAKDAMKDNAQRARSMNTELYSRNLETFQVTEYIDRWSGILPRSYGVDLRNRRCEYGMFQTLRYSCLHVVAAYATYHLNVEQYIDDVYTLERTLRIWGNEFPVLRDVSTWEVQPPAFKMLPDRSPRKKVKGRPTTMRI
ncbi:hypothetical protein GOBAR_DD22203 [Gossypium barbadense]|nr:hypothetical protein GOBAR_DD22203 [Gossypium barbadense]